MKKINNLYLYPEIRILKGIGIFSSKELDFESHFEVIHFPQKTIVTTEIKDNKSNLIDIRDSDGYWSLKGLTEENFNIYAENLLFTDLTNNKLTLYSFKDFTIEKSKIDSFTSAEFPLVGLYKGNFNTKIENWEISIVGNKEIIEKIQEKSKNWNMQLEGLHLKLVKPNFSKDKFLSKAKDITSLLSLALGNDKVFNRQLYYQENELSQEYWRRMVDHNFGAGASVPDCKLDIFLKKSLHIYEKWDAKKKKIFYSTVTGINSSSRGFLEDRILRICIAWEGLAGSWSKNKKSSNSELEPLKKMLLETLEGSNLPSSVDKDFIKTRISSSLDWEKATDSLTNFSNQYLLNTEKLKLDFKSLVKVRNDIAHSGLFRKKYTTEFIIDLINNHKLALQVILLKELGYDGLVVTRKNKWIAHAKMEELTKPGIQQ
ncbi:MAG TPA: HEPN domain-containing protein [Flavobacterium sp.]|nr:HEPN domain-containing protein [Flavobacterium sp.]